MHLNWVGIIAKLPTLRGLSVLIFMVNDVVNWLDALLHASGLCLGKIIPTDIKTQTKVSTCITVYNAYYLPCANARGSSGVVDAFLLINILTNPHKLPTRTTDQ